MDNKQNEKIIIIGTGVFFVFIIFFILLISFKQSNQGISTTDSNTNITQTSPPLSPPQPLICTSFQYSDWSHCTANGTQNRTIVKALPDGCVGGSSIQSQNCTYEPLPQKNDLLNVSLLTPQTIKKIVQKIRFSPNASCGGMPCIKTTYDSGTANVSMIYELATDPLEPESKEALVVEISSYTYIDKYGGRLPEKDIDEDFFQFRDTDFDAMPNDYWSNDFGKDLRFKTITDDMPDATNLLGLWIVGINYFYQNLLK